MPKSFASICFIAIAIVTTASVEGAGYAERSATTHSLPKAKAALARCVYLKKKIHRYTQLRRSGGSAARMESWRTSRRRYADEYREKRCDRYGRQLREAMRSS